MILQTQCKTVRFSVSYMYVPGSWLTLGTTGGSGRDSCHI